MAYGSEVFSTAYNRMKDWLIEANDGGNVTDLALDLLNRAQERLRMYRPWEELVKQQALTVSSKTASLPSDCGEILALWHDSDSDGHPDFYYYNRSRRVDTGYRMTDSFTKAAGHARTITFYAAPSYTVYLEYIIKLDDFANSGTEYSFFPIDLLVAQAQIIHYTEQDLVDEGYRAVFDNWQRLLVDYEQAHSWRNIDMRWEITDDQNNDVEQEVYSLIDGPDVEPTNSDPSYDNRH